MLRDMVGYGPNLPLNGWPGNTKLAINFVINYEEGAELSPVNGDLTAETYGGEFPLAAKPSGMRNLSMESLFEYGSRCGIWRLIRLFEQEQIPLTFFITGLAIRLNRELGSYLRNTSHEAAGHGWRWIDYAQMSKEEEKSILFNVLMRLKRQLDVGLRAGIPVDEAAIHANCSQRLADLNMIPRVMPMICPIF